MSIENAHQCMIPERLLPVEEGRHEVIAPQQGARAEAGSITDTLGDTYYMTRTILRSSDTRTCRGKCRFV